MVGPRGMKIGLKKKVLAVLKRDGEAQLDVLTSSLKLDSGFSNKVVSELLNDMNTVDLIDVKNGVITLTEKGKNYGVEQ